MKTFKNKISMALLAFALFTHVHAEETQPTNQESSCEQSYQAKVNGLVCDFCARALEKVFGKKDEVKGINVDLDAGLVTINFNDGQNLPAEDVKSLIVDSGYNVVSYGPACDDE